jgi:hypothetical protein
MSMIMKIGYQSFNIIVVLSPQLMSLTHHFMICTISFNLQDLSKNK